MAESVLSQNKNSNNSGANKQLPGWVAGLVFGIMLVAIGCVVFAPAILGTASKPPKSSSSTDTTDTTNASDKQSELEDKCIVTAQSHVNNSNIKVTTVAGLVDGDSNTVGKNKNGDPMTLYRWYGEKDGERIMFACYAAVDSNGEIGVASISMNLDTIYIDPRYDFAE